MENLITIKETGNCNSVYNDCLIGIESWSNNLLRNRPVQDNSVIGTLITFKKSTVLYIYNRSIYKN